MIKRLMVLIGLLSGAACVDGPFARRNPYDPLTDVTARLVVHTDTVSVLGEIALVEIITEPPVDLSVHPPQWRSTRTSTLVSLGGGQFQLIAIPEVPTPVIITAAYPGFTLSAVIVAGRP